MPAAGENISVSDILLALNRRLGTTTGDSDGTSLSFSGETTVDSVTVSVVSGRTYRVKWIYHWCVPAASSSTLRARIRTGSTAGSQLTYRDHTYASSTPSEPLVLEVDWTASVTGTQTFVGTGLRTAGAVNLQFRGATSQPRSLTVEYAYG